MFYIRANRPDAVLYIVIVREISQRAGSEEKYKIYTKPRLGKNSHTFISISAETSG